MEIVVKLIHIFYSETEKYSVRFRSEIANNLTEIEQEFWYSKKSSKRTLNIISLLRILRRDVHLVFHGLYFKWWQTIVITLYIKFNLTNARCLIWFPWGADVYTNKQTNRSIALYAQYLLRRQIISSVDFICTAFQGEMKYIEENYEF